MAATARQLEKKRKQEKFWRKIEPIRKFRKKLPIETPDGRDTTLSDYCKKEGK